MTINNLKKQIKFLKMIYNKQKECLELSIETGQSDEHISVITTEMIETQNKISKCKTNICLLHLMYKKEKDEKRIDN